TRQLSGCAPTTRSYKWLETPSWNMNSGQASGKSSTRAPRSGRSAMETTVRSTNPRVPPCVERHDGCLVPHASRRQPGGSRVAVLDSILTADCPDGRDWCRLSLARDEGP